MIVANACTVFDVEAVPRRGCGITGGDDELCARCVGVMCLDIFCNFSEPGFDAGRYLKFCD